MGLYGSLVSLDADGEHVHPLEAEGAQPERSWFSRFSHKLMAAFHKLTHR